jgi:tape measure domain-containing protein
LADQRAEYEIRLNDKFSQALGKLDKLVDKFDRKVDGVSKRSSMSFASIGKSLGSLGLVVGAGALVTKIGKLGIEMEQTRVSFSTFLGDAEKANQVISELNQFSNVTPFDNAQVIKAGKGLLAFGTSADKLIPALKQIGDISAGTGKDFNELATIYGKARVQGTLYAEDINQLVEAGVPIMGEFAKALGTTEENVKKLASQGRLKFKDLETAFKNLTSEGGLFFNLMEKQSKTVGGQLSTLVGKLQTIGISIGEKLLPPLNAFVDVTLKAVGALDRLLNKAKALESDSANSFQKYAGAFTDIMPLVEKGQKGLLKDADAIAKIANQFPEAISKFNRYGEAVEINFAKVATSIKSLQQEAIADNKNLVKELGDRQTELIQKIRTINAFTPEERAMFKGGEAQAQKDLGDFKREFDNIQGRINQLKAKRVQLLSNSFAPSAGSDGGLLEQALATQTTGSKISSAITGSSPKNVTLNITKLVETINFNQQNMKQNANDMTEQVKRALLVALNDVAIVQR